MNFPSKKFYLSGETSAHRLRFASSSNNFRVLLCEYSIHLFRGNIPVQSSIWIYKYNEKSYRICQFSEPGKTSVPIHIHKINNTPVDISVKYQPLLTYASDGNIRKCRKPGKSPLQFSITPVRINPTPRTVSLQRTEIHPNIFFTSNSS